MICCQAGLRQGWRNRVRRRKRRSIPWGRLRGLESWRCAGITMNNRDPGVGMTFVKRQNLLVSQRLDVALVYKEMLGTDEAMAYLHRENIPENIAERVLRTDRKRSSLATQIQTPVSTPPATGCRRKNHLHDAIVEAALKIEGKMGQDWARTLLANEHVPDQVVERILAAGPRQLRVRAPRR